MELVLKIPQGKPPFVGILFAVTHEAAALNADLVINHRHKNYKLIFEVVGTHLNLRLICEDLVTVRFYNHIKFSPEKLKSWLYIIYSKKVTVINFGHITTVKDKHELVKTTPQSKNFVLKVIHCQLLSDNNSL